jgi:hypothetical protein
MQTDNSSPKPPVSHYGKKIYYINPLIVQRATLTEKEPEYLYEDIEEDKDR